MADTLIELLTGQGSAADVPVTVNLVISDQALLGDIDEPGHLDGAGPIPAKLARAWLSKATRASLRRLYARPEDGQLVAMEARSRTFPSGLATLIRFRDQTCRTTWCDAPVRHLDHQTAAVNGGATSYLNGQGRCEACNLAKADQDWTHRTSDPPPGARPWTLPTRTELYLSEIVLAS